MRFESPEMFALLLILLPLLWVLQRGERRTNEVARIYNCRSPRHSFFIVRMVLLSLFIGSLTAVAAKPFVLLDKTGDFIILVDVSRSMHARNSCGEPTFLGRAKNIIRDILEAIPEGRFSIVAFDRLAFPITQMTHNRDYLNEVVEQGLHVGLTFEATDTEIANALSVVVRKKHTLPESYGSVSRIVLLSDGNVEGDYRRRMREPITELRNAGMAVLAVGIGNPGETRIMKMERGRCINEHIVLDGQPVLVPLRDDILRYIAGETQGQYIAEGETEELFRVLRRSLVKRTDTGENSSEGRQRDISWVFLSLGTAALAGLLILNLRTRFS